MSNELRFKFPEAYQRGENDCIATNGDITAIKNPYPLPHPAAWACWGGSEWHAWNRAWNETLDYTRVEELTP